MKYFKLSLSALFCIFSMQANAQDPQGLSYNFIEGGFSTLEIDVGANDVDGDGFDIGGSFEVTDMIFIAAGFSDTEFDFNIDSSEAWIGIGGHTPIADRTDVYGIFSLIDAEIESNDESGYGFDVGIRHLLNDQIELDGSVGYQDVFSDSSTSFTFGGRYYFTDAISAGASYTNTEIDDDDMTGFRISARLNF